MTGLSAPNSPFFPLGETLRPGAVRILFLLAMLCVGWLGTGSAQDHVTASTCPSGGSPPVQFQIDCSHLSDPATKALCKPFIENQACKVFPAYRKITGIHLEDTCKSIKFAIYDDAHWPHGKGEGGLALQCGVDYLAQNSVRFRSNSRIGPYDVHELLHEYQIALGALPYPHVLFSSSMAEATREIGDIERYDQLMRNMKDEAQHLEQTLQNTTAASSKQCQLAQTQLEESLYLENPGNVYMFYLKLGPDKAGKGNIPDREARFSRML